MVRKTGARTWSRFMALISGACVMGISPAYRIKPKIRGGHPVTRRATVCHHLSAQNEAVSGLTVCPMHQAVGRRDQITVGLSFQVMECFGSQPCTLIWLFFFLVHGELLTERCRTDDLMSSIPVLCLPQAVWTPKFWGWTSSSVTLIWLHAINRQLMFGGDRCRRPMICGRYAVSTSAHA